MASGPLQQRRLPNRPNTPGVHKTAAAASKQGKSSGKVTAKLRPSIRSRIRGVERLLSRPTLPEAIRAAQEAKLQELLRQQESRTLTTEEKKISQRYKKVRFTEKVKLQRRLRSAQRALEDATEAAPERTEEIAALKAKVDQVQADLDYVVNFPPGEKYVSLLVGPEDAQDAARVQEERQRLRTRVRELMEARAAAAAARRGKRGKGEGIVVVPPADGRVLDVDPEDIEMIVFDDGDVGDNSKQGGMAGSGSSRVGHGGGGADAERLQGAKRVVEGAPAKRQKAENGAVGGLGEASVGRQVRNQEQRKPVHPDDVMVTHAKDDGPVHPDDGPVHPDDVEASGARLHPTHARAQLYVRHALHGTHAAATDSGRDSGSGSGDGSSLGEGPRGGASAGDHTAPKGHGRGSGAGAGVQSQGGGLENGRARQDLQRVGGGGGNSRAASQDGDGQGEEDEEEEEEGDDFFADVEEGKARLRRNSNSSGGSRRPSMPKAKAAQKQAFQTRAHRRHPSHGDAQRDDQDGQRQLGGRPRAKIVETPGVQDRGAQKSKGGSNAHAPTPPVESAGGSVAKVGKGKGYVPAAGAGAAGKAVKGGPSGEGVPVRSRAEGGRKRRKTR